MTDPIPAGPWRVGRSRGRTIVIQVGPEPTRGSEPGGDVLIGLARTQEIAQAACDAVNAGRRIPGTRWWSSGGLVYDRPGASLTRGWIIAMFDPGQAQRIVAAVRGEELAGLVDSAKRLMGEPYPPALGYGAREADR